MQSFQRDTKSHKTLYKTYGEVILQVYIVDVLHTDRMGADRIRIDAEEWDCDECAVSPET